MHAVMKPILLSLYALSFLATVLQLNGWTLHCPENELQALLDFKRVVTDQSNRLSSWVGKDCCQWKGVACNNITGHVIKLDLRNPFPYNSNRAIYTPGNSFFGDRKDYSSDPIYERSCLIVHEVNSSLLELKHLNYLDFSWNNFSLVTIPKFFGSFQKLEYLNLSEALFSGDIPHLGNLSALHSLDLSFSFDLRDGPYYNERDDYPYPTVKTLHWISTLHSLKHLDLSGLGLDLFNGGYDTTLASLEFPPLLELHLSNCDLSNYGGSLFHSLTNLTSLLTLDLSKNQFNDPFLSTVPHTNLTSIVILDLSFNQLSGPIPTWNMTSLEVLDLSVNRMGWNGPLINGLNKLNNLRNMKILNMDRNDYYDEMDEGNFTIQKLETLYLSRNSFSGPLPSWLCLLNGLRKLDLSSNNLEGPVPSSFGLLSNLKELNLESNQLNGSIPASLGNLSSLEVLNLESNQLSGLIPMSIWRLSSLTTLKLGDNKLRGKIPLSIGELTNLTHLDVSLNQLSGQIPISITKLSNLVTLDLSENRLTGKIPTSVGNLSNLTKLDLSSNKFSGIVPQTLGQLSNLTLLDLSNNSLNGIVSEVHFATLSKLDSLNLSMNMLSFQLGSIDWIPPFQLTYILLGSCDMGPKFPGWLRTQTHWKRLNMSNASISDSIPHWLEKLPPSIDSVDLSHNKIHGIPNFTTPNLPFDPQVQILLNSNRLEGPLQSFPSNLGELDLSNNNITGPIPNSLCSMNNLLYLDLSTNRLSGDIPHCLSSITNIGVINFSSNNLSGTIPSSIGKLKNLRSLYLSNNLLVGEIPLALQDCRSLVILDLGDNALSGQIPEWIGANKRSLAILRLRSNQLNGTLLEPLCHLERLHILDVSQNHLSGSIPHCFGNFTLMFLYNKSTSDDPFRFIDISGNEKINQTIKGKELEYVKILQLLFNLDLSANHFTGDIPEELTSLSGLIGLNLSRNHLTGNIPKNINRMQSLESLDLSMNQFSGKIPQSISLLFKLNYLNLSYNDLSGPIPSSTQLQTLEDPSIYRGNKLCGPPLEKKCFEVENPHSPPKGKDKERQKLRISSLYMGMIVGHVLGFWGICVILLFKKTWRYACFRFVENIYDRLYVIIVIQMNRLKKKNLKRNDTDE